MTETERGDAVWQQALGWIMREHEESLDDTARQALRGWLASTPAHRQAYEQARTVWLLTGLVPIAEDLQAPPLDDDNP